MVTENSDKILYNGNAGGGEKLTWDAVVIKDMNLLNLPEHIDFDIENGRRRFM